MSNVLAITKENLSTVEEKLEAFAAKLGKGLEVSTDSEFEPKDGYFAVTVYFEHVEQIAAIAKAKTKLAKQVADGTLGEEPEKAAPKKAAAAEKAPAKKAAPAKVSAAEKSNAKTAAEIVEALAEYDVKVKPEQVAAAMNGKIDARFAKSLAKLLDNEELVEEIGEEEISMLIAALCKIEFETKDALIKKLMKTAVKAIPALLEGDDDEEEEEKPAKSKAKAKAAPAKASKAKAKAKDEEEDEDEDEDESNEDWEDEEEADDEEESDDEEEADDEEEEEEDDEVEVKVSKAKGKGRK